MKLGIMQPYFFPYIGYFQIVNAVDRFILYENSNFIRQGWMHKNRILIKNNEPNYISVRINKKSSFKKIYEITLIEDERWKEEKILRTIRYNYAKSKFYEDIYPLIEHLITFHDKNFHTYISKIILGLCEFLSIKTDIRYQNTKYLDLEEKLKVKFGPEKMDKDNFNFDEYDENYDKKTVRLIEICKSENADIFINAIGGKSLYSKRLFDDFGIDLFFLKTKNISYKQLCAEFFPNLSIIDVLMNCGKVGTKKLLNEYKLV